MAGEKDQIKGRIEEATGVITHNEPLKRERESWIRRPAR